MSLRAVLFDLDGVLIDSFDAWLATVNEVARAWGFPGVTRERFRSIFGQGLSEDAKNLFPGRTVDEIRTAFDSAMPGQAGAVRLNPEAHRVLRRLAEHGRKTAIVTNTQGSLADAVLAATGISRLVDAVVALRPGLREKPAPDLLLEALARLEVPPADALLVGDTRYDEESARAAGTGFLRYEFATGDSLASALASRLDTSRRV